MNHLHFLQSRSLHTRRLTAVFSLGVLTVSAVAASFQQGDEIRITKSVPLYFREQTFRNGKEGETFPVLAYRPELKKVFVLGKSQDGKDIALSIAEDAVALVPKDSVKLQQLAIAAAKAGRFPEALRILGQVPRSDRANPQFTSLEQAIAALQKAKQQLDGARAQQQQANVTAAQKRKNAATVDRPNRLNPDDTSNQTRAAQIRQEADQLETSAKQGVAEAEARHRSALSALDRSIAAPPTMARVTPQPAARIEVVPGRELTEIEKRQMQDQVEADAAGARTLAIAEGEQWKTIPCNIDRFVEPDLPNRAGPPSYAETVAFINGKLAPFAEVGYGEKTQKFIIRFFPQEEAGETFVFDPADLNAKVRYEALNRVFGNEVKTEGRVVLQAHNGAAKIVDYLPSRTPDGLINAQGAFTSSVLIGVNGTLDEVNAQKLAKAFAHLIAMFGGKEEAF